MPISTIHQFIKTSLLLSVLLMSNAVQATLVGTSLQGTVTLDNAGNNPFGLTTGDTVSASAIYDDVLVVGTSPDEQIFIDGLADWKFSITLGTFSFTQTDVTDPTFTSFYYDMGRLDGISFFIDPITIGGFNDLVIEDFNGGTSLFVEHISGSPVYLELDWDFVNATQPAPVPLPGAVWLFLSALMGLVAGKVRQSSSYV